MKRERGTHRQRSGRADTSRQARRLFVEQLESRALLAGAPPAFDFGLPELPAAQSLLPESYRSPKLSDDLAELAYEYDQWLHASVSYGFAPSNSRIFLDGHRVYVVALSTGAGSAVADELSSIGGELVSVGDTDASAWLPIGDVESLTAASDLLFAHAVTNSAIPLQVAPLSIALPFGPDSQTFHSCGDSQCLTIPELLGAAMLPDGTLRLVGSSANFNPSPLTVWDVNSKGEILRQFGLPQAMHVNPFSGIGGAISLSPDGQWMAIGDELYNIDEAAQPQTVPTPDDAPIGAQLIGHVANDGRLILSWNGKSYIWDQASGLKRLDSLFAGNPEANPIQLETDANAISADGRTVVGDSGLNGDYGHATVWDDFGAHALPDLGRPSSASAISGDGHIIGGGIRGVGAVVWIDWRLKALVDEQGRPLSGSVTSIVTGFGGYQGAWAAFGTAAGKPFVAFDDGIAHPLGDWLDQRYGVELSDESLMGAFYHDGALSLVTAHYTNCIGWFPDPIDCEMTPPTQLAAHLTVVPVGDGVGNEDSHRPAPFTAHLAPNSISLNSSGTIVPTADGFRALGSVGNETVINEYDRAGQLTSTIHLTQPPLPGTFLGASQFSDDGRWVKGLVYSPAGELTPIYWDLEHPDQPLTGEQLGATSKPSFSTATASEDGRVVATSVESDGGSIAAVKVDGVVHEIRDADGTPVIGQVNYVFAGIGGVATRWIAVGQTAAGGYGGNFIAFSDGSMMKLSDFIHDQWPSDVPVMLFSPYVAIGSGSILFVEQTFSGGNCSGGLGCGNVMIDTGYGVTVVPLPDKWIRSPLDINRDGATSAADALAVINYLNGPGSGSSATVLGTHSTLDIDDDGFVAPRDLLIIINQLNALELAAASPAGPAAASGEGEAATTPSMNDSLAAAADVFFQSLQPGRRLAK